MTISTSRTLHTKFVDVMKIVIDYNCKASLHPALRRSYGDGGGAHRAISQNEI